MLHICGILYIDPQEINMDKLATLVVIAAISALSGVLFSYALDVPFLKVYAMIGAIWVAFNFLLPAKYRS